MLLLCAENKQNYRESKPQCYWEAPQVVSKWKILQIIKQFIYKIHLKLKKIHKILTFLLGFSREMKSLLFIDLATDVAIITPSRKRTIVLYKRS